MIVRKSLSVLAAFAVMLAFALPSALPAASLVGPGAKVKTDTMIDTIAKKKGKKGKKGKAKASKGGTCGAYMYWSKASKKCVDTRVTPPAKK